MTDLYDTLGVQRDARKIEIRAAYKKLASKYHPDKNNGDPEATAKFQVIQKAYAILSDEARRKAYDETGATGETQTPLEVAVNMVGALMLELTEEYDYAKTNYVNLVAARIRDAKVDCSRASKGYQKALDCLGYIQETTATGGKLDTHFTLKVAEITADLARATEALEIMDVALEYLDTCSYSGEDIRTTEYTFYETAHKMRPDA